MFLTPVKLIRNSVGVQCWYCLAREQEAPETDWAEWEAGLVYLEKGPTSLVIKAKEILGEKSIELKDVVLEFQPGSGKVGESSKEK